MKRKSLFLLVCFSIILNIYSQKKISIDKIYATMPVDVAMPVMVDTTNLKGEKFEYKNLLETFVTLPAQDEYTDELMAEVMREYFFLPKPQEGARFRFLSFRLNTDRFASAKVRITSPGMYELYIDGKKELTKTTVEDSLTLAKVLDKEVTMVPGSKEFVIKYLSLASNVAPEGVKIAIEPQGKDSAANFTVGYGNKRYANIEDVLEGTRINNARISPDGRFLLLDYKSVNSEGKSNTYTELYDTRNSRTIRLGMLVSGWMPTSTKYYYVNRNEDKLRLVAVDPETFAETVIAPDVPSGSFFFTPDEKTLIYTEKESFDGRKGDLKRILTPEDRQPGYYDRYFIFKYDLSTGIKQRLTFGRHSTYVHNVSPDSRHLLFSTNEETPTQAPFSANSMFMLDLYTLSVDTLWTNDAFAQSARFSPDGSKLLIIGGASSFDGIGLNISSENTPNSFDKQVFIMDMSTKSIEPVTKNFNPSVSAAYWNKADNMVYMKAEDEDYERIYRYDPRRKSFDRLDLGEDVVRMFSLSQDVAKAAYIGISASNSTRAYIVDLKNEKYSLVSDPMKPAFDSLILGDVNDWNFTSSDGTLIKGRYYLPPNFDSTKKYPMIVYYYGGTSPTQRMFDFPYPMHVYSAQGYVVYVVQPSGTTGFGQDFSARHVNAWGKYTADEIIEGTKKFIAEHSFVDEKKIGCIGASYGGFMTMYLQTRTDIFAAAVSHAGISSLASYWGEGYWGYTYSAIASAGSYPWNNKELYIEQSPLFNADKIHTPLLLLHGTDDTNVPIGESIQMYTALKILGRPVEFIQVKGENHGVADYKRRKEWNYSIYAWFAKWLKDDSAWWDNLYPLK